LRNLALRAGPDGATVIELGADVTPACWPRLTWAARQLNVSA
jgi:hypothetical protein